MAIREYLMCYRTGNSYDLVEGITTILKKENKDFNCERFKNACEPRE